MLKRYSAGLDPHVRPVLSELLRSLHESDSPRIIMALRAQDPLPEWITHVLKVSDGRADTVKASEFAAAKKDSHAQVARQEHAAAAPDERPPIVQLKNVNVKYHERHVCTVSSGKPVLTSFTGLAGCVVDDFTRREMAFARLQRCALNAIPRFCLTPLRRLRKDNAHVSAHWRPPTIIHKPWPLPLQPAATQNPYSHPRATHRPHVTRNRCRPPAARLDDCRGPDQHWL